jgi:hypothetical protein
MNMEGLGDWVMRGANPRLHIKYKERKLHTMWKNFKKNLFEAMVEYGVRLQRFGY